MFPYLKIFDLEISVYFLVLSLIFSFAVPLIVKRADRLQLSSIQALDIYLCVLIGAFLGSRWMYVLYQEPSFYWSNPEQILFFWNGGYIFFGGVLGAISAGYVYCKFKKIEPETWLNFAAPILSLGYAFGRLSCFLSGCCYGKEVEAWWAVFMHQAYRHPTQLYAAVMEFLILGFLILVEQKRGFKAFLVMPLWMVLHGFARIFMEHFRADPRGGEIFGLSISTNISLGLIAVGLTFLTCRVRVNCSHG